MFREIVIGDVLFAPVGGYAVAAVLIFLMLRPILHLIGFNKLFSNPSIAELGLCITIFGLITLAS